VKPSRPSRRTAALAAAAALLLSSCGQTTPGAAAVVDGTAIPLDRVDDFAQVLCSLRMAPDQAPTTPSEGVRFQSLQILLNDQLALGVVDPEAADRAEVNAAVEQLSRDRDKLPAAQREVFDEVVREYAEAQTALVALGRSTLQQAGRTNVSPDAAYQAGDRLRNEYARTADVEVDPRFGTFQDGALVPGDGSLSVPVSDFAEQAAADAPSESFVTELPVSQTCG